MALSITYNPDKCSFKIVTGEPQVDVYDSSQALDIMFEEEGYDSRILYERISTLEGKIVSHKNKKIKVVVEKTCLKKISCISIFFKIDGSYSNSIRLTINGDQVALGKIMDILFKNNYLIPLRKSS